MASKTKNSDAIASVGYDANKWRAESDCDTLIRAEEIERDAARLKAARAVAKQRLAALNDVMTDDDTAGAKKGTKG